MGPCIRERVVMVKIISAMANELSDRVDRKLLREKCITARFRCISAMSRNVIYYTCVEMCAVFTFLISN